MNVTKKGDGGKFNSQTKTCDRKRKTKKSHS